MELSLLLDARKLGDGGIGVYIENLLSGLSEFARDVPGIEVTCLVRSQRLEAYSKLVSFPHIVEDSPDYSVKGMWELGALVNRICEERKIKLFHSPHYTLPMGVKVPTVVTIHDMIHLKYPPRWHTPFFAQVLIRHALRKAKKVITVSQSSGLDVLEYFPTYESKMCVIPNAFPTRILESEPIPIPKLENERFLLAVLSTSKPHKGRVDLLMAWERVRQKHPEKLLVLVGPGAPKREAEGVRELGEVDQQQLLWLIREATALVVPSFIEGFCLPALEARTIGTPVIARPIPALQELLGAHGFFAKDLSTEAMSEMLDRFASAGKARILPDAEFFDLFSGENFTLRHLKVYEEVLSR